MVMNMHDFKKLYIKRKEIIYKFGKCRLFVKPLPCKPNLLDTMKISSEVRARVQVYMSRRIMRNVGFQAGFY